MKLRFLDFDFSEDTEGVGTFEAMASVGPQQVAALHAEVAHVLAWAYAQFGSSQHGPIDEGGFWDHELQAQREYTASEVLEFDERSGQLSVQLSPPGAARHSLTLSLTGTEAFCQAFDLALKQAAAQN
jgi:hypothetical protein